MRVRSASCLENGSGVLAGDKYLILLESGCEKRKVAMVTFLEIEVMRSKHPCYFCVLLITYSCDASQY